MDTLEGPCWSEGSSLPNRRGEQLLNWLVAFWWEQKLSSPLKNYFFVLVGVFLAKVFETAWTEELHWTLATSKVTM